MFKKILAEWYNLVRILGSLPEDESSNLSSAKNNFLLV